MKGSWLKVSLLVVLLNVGCIAWADEPPPVINDPVGFWEKAKQIIDRTEPRAGAFLNLENQEWSATTAAKVFSGEIKGYALEGIAGYGINGLVYASLETDVLNAISKFTGWTLEIPWLSVNIGPGIGYTFDAQGDEPGMREGSNFAYGFSLNASAKF